MKVTKAQYDGLPADLKKLFKQVEGSEDYDNGEEDASAIKGARDRERDQAKKLRDEKTALETRITELETEIEEGGSGSAGKDEEINRIKEKAKRDLDKVKADSQAKTDKLLKQLRSTHVDAVAEKLAAEISTVPELMKGEIARFLGVNLDGDSPLTEVLDAEGKPTARTIQELKQDFLSNQRFSSILIGSKGSGGGAGGGGNGGGAFDIATYRNQDGTTNWTKVHEGMKGDPTLLTKVKEANLQVARGEGSQGSGSQQQ